MKVRDTELDRSAPGLREAEVDVPLVMRLLRKAASRRRDLAILAASVGLHGLVLGYFALHTVRDSPRYETRPRGAAPPLFLDIEPRRRTLAERPRGDEAERPVSRASPTQQSERISQSLREPRLDRLASAHPAQSPESGETRREPSPETADGRPERAPRLGVRCRYPELLSQEERGLCARRYSDRTQTRAITGTGDVRRDQRFALEGARALDRYDARRRPPEGGTGLTRPADCPGSNFGAGCPGAHLAPGFRQDRNDDLSVLRKGN